MNSDFKPQYSLFLAIAVYNRPLSACYYSNMNVLSENILSNNLRNGSVEVLEIVQELDGRYRLDVRLTWSASTYTLVTTRGTVKAWVSLDTLVNHITSRYGEFLPIIFLVLNNNGVKVE